jgi:hypothetical protein
MPEDAKRHAAPGQNAKREAKKRRRCGCRVNNEIQ